MKKLLFIFPIIIFSIITFGQAVDYYQVSSIANMKSFTGRSNHIHVSATGEDFELCTSCTADEFYVFAGTSGRKWKKISDPNKVEIVCDIDALIAYNGTANAVVVKDTATGEGGVFIMAEAGYGTVNNGTVYPATGKGGGTRTWFRQFRFNIAPGWFGAVGNGTFNDRVALQAAIDFAWSQAKQITSDVDSVQLYTNNITIDLGGRIYGIDSTINIYPGTVLTNGTIKALNDMRYMVSTYPYANDITSGYTYRQKNIQLKNITLDGDNLAQNGLLFETASGSIVSDVYVVRCTNPSWIRNTMTVSASTASQSTIIKVNSNTAAYRNANVMIWRPSASRYLTGVYQIGYVKSTDTLQLYSGMSEATAIGDVIIHTPTGIIVNSNEANFTNINSNNNTLGMMVGRNTDAVAFYDNSFYKNAFRGNKVGIALNGAQRDRFYGLTSHFNQFYNVCMMSGRNNIIYDWHPETNSTDSLVGSENYCQGYFENDWGYVRVINAYTPSKGWNRILCNDSKDLWIDYEALNNTQVTNPNHTNDNSIVRIVKNKNANPSIILNLQGPNSFSDLDSLRYAVVDVDYSTYANALISSEARRLSTYAGQRIEYTQMNYAAGSTISLWNASKTKPSVTLKDSAIYFGDGTSSTQDVSIKRTVAGRVAVNADLSVPGKIYNTNTTAGAGGTDSVVVKGSDGSYKAISPTYYGTGSPVSQFVSGSDVTTTSGSATNITGLTGVTVGANKKYRIVAVLYIGMSATGGTKFAINGPAGATVSSGVWAGSSATVNASKQGRAASSMGTLSGVSFNTSAASGGMVTFVGYVATSSTAGTLSLQFASATATETSTVFIGSGWDILEIQ